MNTLNLVPFVPDARNEVIRIANESFGDGYMTIKGLKKLEDTENSFFIAEQENQILGYCVFTYEPIDVLATKLKMPADSVRSHTNNLSELVCYTKSMAVEDKFKKSGLASRLFAKCLDDAVNRKVGSAWGSAWKIGDTVPMDKIFKAYGFHVYGEIPLMWFDDKEYSCIECGGTCRCTGVIYYKQLD